MAMILSYCFWSWSAMYMSSATKEHNSTVEDQTIVKNIYSIEYNIWCSPSFIASKNNNNNNVNGTTTNPLRSYAMITVYILSFAPRAPENKCIIRTNCKLSLYMHKSYWPWEERKLCGDLDKSLYCIRRVYQIMWINIQYIPFVWNKVIESSRFSKCCIVCDTT